MDWSTVVNLIDGQLLIVVAACWVLGYIIKQTPKVPDWSIVYIVTLFAVVFVVMLTDLSAKAVLQGILCGAAAVYGNQLLKQAAIGKQDMEDKKASKAEPVKTDEPAQAPVKPDMPDLLPDKLELPKQNETPVQAKPAEPTPQPVTARVITQSDIAKPVGVTSDFIVSEDGTITVVGDVQPFTTKVTSVLLPADKKEITFKADKSLYWLIVGASADMDKLAIVGLGAINNIANITVSTKALAFKAGYTKLDLDATHTFAPGNVYKVVNTDNSVEIYYKDGESFKLLYRVAKEAVALNVGTMDWLTARLGAVVGISEADHTTSNIFVEAK